MAPNRQSIASVIRSLSFEDLFVADAKYPALTSASAAAKAAAAAPSCSSQPQPQPQRGGGSDDDDRSEKSRRQRQRQRRATDARAEDEDEDEVDVEVVRAHRLAIRDAEAFFAWPAPSLTPDEEAENGDAERLRGKDDEEREAREREEAVEQVRRMLLGRATTAGRAAGASHGEGNLRGDAVPETRRRRSGGAPESGGDYWRWDSPDDVGPDKERRDDDGAQHARCIPPNPQEKEGEDESEELLLLQYAEGQGCPVGTDHGYHGCYYGEAVVGAWEEGMDGMGGGGYGDGYWDV